MRKLRLLLLLLALPTAQAGMVECDGWGQFTDTISEWPYVGWEILGGDAEFTRQELLAVQDLQIKRIGIGGKLNKVERDLIKVQSRVAKLNPKTDYHWEELTQDLSSALSYSYSVGNLLRGQKVQVDQGLERVRERSYCPESHLAVVEKALLDMQEKLADELRAFEQYQRQLSYEQDTFKALLRERAGEE